MNVLMSIGTKGWRLFHRRDRVWREVMFGEHEYIGEGPTYAARWRAQVFRTRAEAVEACKGMSDHYGDGEYRTFATFSREHLRSMAHDFARFVVMRLVWGVRFWRP